MARGATLTCGCAEARLADLAQNRSPNPGRGILALRWLASCWSGTQMRCGALLGRDSADRSHRPPHPAGVGPLKGNRDTSYRTALTGT
jgi:hypothetical protein